MRDKIIKKTIAKLLRKVKDQIPGGVGDKETGEGFDEKQLEKGVEIEMEHTNDPQIALEISLDHLSENPNYYLTDKGEDRLRLMEEEAAKEYEAQQPNASEAITELVAAVKKDPDMVVIVNKTAVRPPSFLVEVIELIDDLKEKGLSKQEISRVILDTYGHKMEIKDILKSEDVL